eukprot:TRINITY_DN360_c0_g1_i2.p1 TRINITY_DN360_c0_g1~~TRINITY_DN360_c0_g1_i2.p1  ORF type:complete len:129 (-),score=20.38 TRINITY_DN360_c0_g1_i2:242-628(-)
MLRSLVGSEMCIRDRVKSLSEDQGQAHRDCCEEASALGDTGCSAAYTAIVQPWQLHGSGLEPCHNHVQSPEHNPDRQRGKDHQLWGHVNPHPQHSDIVVILGFHEDLVDGLLARTTSTAFVQPALVEP